MKKTQKYIAVVLTGILLTLAMVNSVSALLYHQTNATGLLNNEFTPRMTTDPDSITYYIGSGTFLSSYGSYIRTGITSWNSSSYDIDLTEASQYSSSICDVKSYNGDSASYEDYSNALAFTVVYCGDGPYTGNNSEYYDSASIPQDYWGAALYFNYALFTDSVLETSEGIKKLKTVAAHEMGHALGLGHVSGNNYIMRDGYVSAQTQTPASSEKSAVRDLYNYR